MRVSQKKIKKLKFGFDWGLEAHYFINEPMGIGIKFSSFHSSNSSTDLQRTFQDGFTEQGESDDTNITFIGPSVLARIVSANEQNALVSGLP